MILPTTPDAFANDQQIAEALSQAQTAAARRHAAADLPLLQWQDNRLLATAAVITEIKEKKKAPADGGMDDMDY